MPDQQAPDPSQISESMALIAERSQRLISEFLTRQATKGAPLTADPLNIGGAFLELTEKMMADPAKMAEAQMALWQGYLDLWTHTANRMMDPKTEPEITPDRGDRRFKDQAWVENDIFNYIKQSYLLTSRWLQATVNDVEGMDSGAKQKVNFYTRQFVDAISPSNFVMTNPEVLRETMTSGGENLVKGLENLLGDLERGNGKLHIKMTDMDAFEVGENIAVTPGKVVFRNDILELIQYQPTTKTVRKTPLLIMTPWINKYYILDLRPDNSFIKWAVDQGHTVFVTSWVNPDERHADKTFEDYMFEGPMAALDAIEKATGEKDVNVIGYCIGGTLLASTLAYMAVKGDGRIKSATYFTALVNFEEAGELGVFIDEAQLSRLEEKMNERGYLEGRDMASTFSMMRANDLIWSFVINNYLLGKEPFPFDLLYWNADSTRMPASMHSYYLRNMYLENNLIKPGGITLDGVAIDLTKIKTPTYIISTREDHIAPWKATYAATGIYSGPVKFVLSGSGHIAGVVNPPAANKYGYWTNSKKPQAPDAWLEGAKQHEGSWWTDWDKWTKKYAGKTPVAARVPGKGKLKVLADAPGTYVKELVK